MTVLRFEPQRLASSSRLVTDWLSGDAGATGLLPCRSLEAGPATVGSPADRTPMLTASDFRCHGDNARGRLQSLLRGEGFVVSTGQQPQLFGGPLYVLYKALTAVRTARALERDTGHPCLAVFWVASDDHDWPEVAAVELLDRSEARRPLKLDPPPGWAKRSVGPAPLPEAVRDCMSELRRALDVREAGEEWVTLLEEAYVPGRSFSAAFMDIGLRWLEGLPIAFLDAASPAVRHASVPFFESVLGEANGVLEALTDGTAAVTRAGYPAQIKHMPGGVPLFQDHPEGRVRLYASDAGLHAGPKGEPRPLDDFLSELRTAPERFSPGAALRPVLESWLLPVAATVLGPGEIAYWAQLPALFRQLHVGMPVIRPRDSWRLIEPRVDRLLKKAGIVAEDLADGGDEPVAAAVERATPPGVREATSRLMRDLERRFAELDGTVQAEAGGLRSAVGKARNGTLAALDGFQTTLRRHIQEREATIVSQLRRAAQNLYPDGLPQERVFSPFVYLGRYGRAFLEDARTACSGGGATASPDAAPHGKGVAGPSDGG